MSMNNLSYIIPVYNQIKYIDNIIASIKNYSTLRYEIIIVDDGSCEKCKAYLRELECDGVTIIFKDNGGPGSARNVGLKNSNGEYVVFVDCDDEVCVPVYEKMYKNAINDNIDIVLANVVEKYDDTSTKLYKYMINSEDDCWALVNGLISLGGKIYKKNFIAENEALFPEKYQGEDRVFLAKLMINKPKLAYIDDICYYYCRHEQDEEQTLTFNYSIDSFKQRIECWKEFLDLCKGTYPDKVQSDICGGLQGYLFGLWSNLDIQDREEGLKLVISLIKELDNEYNDNIVLDIPIRELKRISTYDAYIQRVHIERNGRLPQTTERLENPEVTIIIPVYNTGKYLNHCLNSLEKQSYRNYELLCVDDGSADYSVSVINDYQYYDKRIVLLKQKRKGAGAARNLAMGYAKGKYLLFLDSDDYFDENLIEKTTTRIKSNDSQICIFSAYQHHDITKKDQKMPWLLKTHLIPDSDPFDSKQCEAIFNITTGSPWNKLYLRSFIEENKLRFMESPRSNDLFFVMAAQALAQRITILDEKLLYYRVANRNSLQANNALTPLDWYNAIKHLKEFLDEHLLYNVFEKSFKNYALSFSIYNLNSINKSKPFIFIYELLKDSLFEELDIGDINEEIVFDYNIPNLKTYYEIKNNSAAEFCYNRWKACAGSGKENNYNGDAEYYLMRVTQSVSFKIGRSITYIPRMIRGYFKRFK